MFPRQLPVFYAFFFSKQQSFFLKIDTRDFRYYILYNHRSIRIILEKQENTRHRLGMIENDRPRWCADCFLMNETWEKVSSSWRLARCTLHQVTGTLPLPPSLRVTRYNWGAERASRMMNNSNCNLFKLRQSFTIQQFGNIEVAESLSYRFFTFRNNGSCETSIHRYAYSSNLSRRLQKIIIVIPSNSSLNWIFDERGSSLPWSKERERESWLSEEGCTLVSVIVGICGEGREWTWSASGRKEEWREETQGRCNVPCVSTELRFRCEQKHVEEDSSSQE